MAVTKNSKKLIALLGPYRNLTTIFATIFHSLDRCVSINHGWHFINLDDDCENLNFDYFLTMAGKENKKISQAHAVRDNSKKYLNKDLMTLFEAADGLENIQPARRLNRSDVSNILWKDSAELTKKLKSLNDDQLRKVFSQNDVMFVRLIRDYRRCIASNIINDYHSFYNLKKTNERDDLENFKKWYKDDLLWCAKWQNNFPDKLYFFDESGDIIKFLCDDLNVFLTENQKQLVSKAFFNRVKTTIDSESYLDLLESAECQDIADIIKKIIS